MALTAKQEQELHLDTKAVVKSFNRDKKRRIKAGQKEVKRLFRRCSETLRKEEFDQFELDYNQLRGRIGNLQYYGARIPKRWDRKVVSLKNLFQLRISEVEKELLEKNDGGRKAAGHKGSARDCVIRGLAIGTGIPYQEIWDYFDRESGKDKSPDDGNSDEITIPYLRSMGWTVRGIELSQTITVAEVAKEGRLAIVAAAYLNMAHVATVKDGQIHDTWNSGLFKVYWIAYPPNDEA